MIIPMATHSKRNIVEYAVDSLDVIEILNNYYTQQSNYICLFRSTTTAEFR